MDTSVALLLAQDGITAGAIYALLALSLILVYSVTRIPFIPMGGFVTFAALSLNALQNGRIAWACALVPLLGTACLLMEAAEAHRRRTASLPRLCIWTAGYVAVPLLLLTAAIFVPWARFPMVVQMAFCLLITVPLAPLVYRLAFQPIEDAGPLTSFMVAISIDVAMVGLALVLFGPEGVRNEPYSDAAVQIASLSVPGAALWIVGVTLLLAVLLYLLFHHTLEGKKLRATAVNRTGARLVGISTSRAGMLAFALAAVIGSVCGLLIGPTTTINSSSGVLIGLKGFVTAVIGGFVSYPVAAIGALAIGVLESFSSFWASAWKDAIVFILVIPILLVRSLSHGTDEEH